MTSSTARATQESQAGLDDRQRYLFDTRGYIVIRGCLSASEVEELNCLFTEAEAAHPPPTEGHGWGMGPSGNALHWGKPFRDLLDHPKVSPVLQDMYGGPPASADGDGQPDREVSFRIDHINVHNWCRPSFIVQHPQYAADACTLHGGGNSGGTPDLPPNNESAGNNQFFRVDEGRFSNGLISVVFELEDTTANGGGFCCVPGSHKQNFPLPQDMRRVADLPDLADEEWLQGVPAEAGDCIVFTEALIHSTLPWRVQTRRRTLFYKFSQLGGSHSKRYYNVEDYEQYPDLTDRQRAILAPPDAGA
jgi:hypothetical protein